MSLLVAGVDEDGSPHLYQVDPSGSFFAWKAAAIGKNMVNAKTFLEKRYSDDLELEDAIHTAILTLKVLLHFQLLIADILKGYTVTFGETQFIVLRLIYYLSLGGLRGTDDRNQHRDWSCG